MRGVAGVQLCALFLFGLLATWTVVACRPRPCPGLAMRRPVGPLGIPGVSLLGLPTVPVRHQKGRQPHADQSDRPGQEHRRPGQPGPRTGSGPTLQQIADAAKQLFSADGAGLMLIDAEGQLRWASASDQTAQTVENEQERLAQGPCAVAFSQRLPAAIRNIRTEPDWAAFAQVLLGEGVAAGLEGAGGAGRGGDRHPGTSMRVTRGTGIPARWRPCRPTPGWWPACCRPGHGQGQGAPGRSAAGRPGASLADRAGQRRRHGPRARRLSGRL